MISTHWARVNFEKEFGIIQVKGKGPLLNP